MRVVQKVFLQQSSPLAVALDVVDVLLVATDVSETGPVQVGREAGVQQTKAEVLGVSLHRQLHLMHNSFNTVLCEPLFQALK